MRILLILDPFIPVPPKGYGGTERINAILGAELVSKGYTVHMIAADGSKPFNGKLVKHFPPGPSKLSRIYRKILFQLLCIRHFPSPDVIINAGRIDYLWYYQFRKTPLVTMFQNPVSDYEDKWIAATPHVVPVGISHNQVKSLPTKNRFRIIHNSVVSANYRFQQSKGRYLVFLGRLTYNKGVDIAIRVAKACSLPLKIAGNISKEAGQQEYYEKEIVPHLGGDIEYIGEVNDTQKNELLGGAIACLFPIRWEEPFGIVMAESLACGTPVIAFGKGSVNEVIVHGENGFICNTDQEMIAAVNSVNTIDRSACRTSQEKYFSSEAMAAKYIQIIAELSASKTE